MRRFVLHNVLMTGVPGAGKTLLVRALPGILPKMSINEALDVTRIYSVADQLPPETYLVILPTSLLVADLPEALTKARDASNAVLVTGPSRTADIEMTLTIGVHGPKEIIVFLVDDSKVG